MQSAAKLAANRANAQRSTGPRTAEGKAKVSRNAVKHGLTAKDVILRNDDERAEFEQLQQSLQQATQPQGALAEDLFRQLVHAAWNIRRVRRLEVELYEKCETDPLLDPDYARQMELIARHATRHERNYHRTLKELRRISTEEASRRRYAKWPEAEELHPMAEVEKVTKQTHDIARAATTMNRHEARNGFPVFIRAALDELERNSESTEGFPNM
jgi:hypothetical protein